MKNALESTNEYTAKEIEFIMALLMNCTHQCGASNLESLLADNFSWFTARDFKNTYSRHQFAGLVSALMDKHIVEDNGDVGGAASLYISEIWLEKMLNRFGNLNWAVKAEAAAEVKAEEKIEAPVEVKVEEKTEKLPVGSLTDMQKAILATIPEKFKAQTAAGYVRNNVEKAPAKDLDKTAQMLAQLELVKKALTSEDTQYAAWAIRELIVQSGSWIAEQQKLAGNLEVSGGYQAITCLTRQSAF